MIRKDTERVMLSLRKDPSSKTFPMRMDLWVRGPKPARHLTRMVENIDTLVLDWLKIKFEITVPCIHCVKGKRFLCSFSSHTTYLHCLPLYFTEGSSDPYQFPLKLIEQAVSTNATYVKCRGIKDVLVSAVAPDVSLAEFRGAKVDYQDIKIVKQIGEGGFAKVYKVTMLCFRVFFELYLIGLYHMLFAGGVG